METPTQQVEMPSEYSAIVINPWLVGADPEFAVLTPPAIVKNAGQHSVNLNLPGVGAIGFDHSGRVWELRPEPSPSAYSVVVNLWKLLRRVEMDRVGAYKWKSGALGGTVGAVAFGEPPMIPDTLGGHVHFGCQQLNAGQQRALKDLTSILLNLEIFPAKENAARIKAGQYGHSADWIRPCNGHVEWRAAPSWLDKPGQAFAGITALKLAAARPSSVNWADNFELKRDLLRWLEDFASVDVDAWMLTRLIEKQGFAAIQADPDADFKPRWRRDDPWAR